MKVTFLGTTGQTEARTRRHGKQAAAVVSATAGRGRSAQCVMIDCGEDWLELLGDIKPAAILLTHAHPHHTLGLRNGAPCPVWATEETWAELRDYPIGEKRIVEVGVAFELMGILIEAFEVEHSLRCPAVAYRMETGRSRMIYAPDVAAIADRARALRGVDVYIGDGSTLTAAMVRRTGTALIGHATVKSQLGWCRAEGVKKAVFTHCGLEVVSREEGEAEEQVRRLGLERAVDAVLAFDGMEMVV